MFRKIEEKLTLPSLLYTPVSKLIIQLNNHRFRSSHFDNCFHIYILSFQFAVLFGMTDHTSDSVGNKMEETLDVIRQVNEQLKDAVSDFDNVLKIN